MPKNNSTTPQNLKKLHSALVALKNSRLKLLPQVTLKGSLQEEKQNRSSFSFSRLTNALTTKPKIVEQAVIDRAKEQISLLEEAIGKIEDFIAHQVEPSESKETEMRAPSDPQEKIKLHILLQNILQHIQKNRFVLKDFNTSAVEKMSDAYILENPMNRGLWNREQFAAALAANDSEAMLMIANQARLEAMPTVVNHAKAKRSEDTAKKYYKLAADQGHPLAMYHWASYLRTEHRHEEANKLFKEAKRGLKTLAERGNPSAEVTLARYYWPFSDSPKFIEPNPIRAIKAVKLYKSAANANHAGAQFALGWFYENSVGVEENVKEALKLYQLAADQGYADAQVTLGQRYERGIGVKKNIKEAFRLYQLAAAQGYAWAQDLGRCYEHGIGVEKNMEEALKLYRPAAEKGYAWAQVALGRRYKHGIGVEKNIKEAKRLYKLAVQQGNADAQVALGSLYEKGLGVEKDTKKALKLYKLASDQGNPAGEVSLGWFYEYGIEVVKNPGEAARLYGFANAQGDPDGQALLGRCYEEGIGVGKDINTALRLYRRAAEQGHEGAERRLEEHREKTSSLGSSPAFFHLPLEFVPNEQVNQMLLSQNGGPTVD